MKIMKTIARVTLLASFALLGMSVNTMAQAQRESRPAVRSGGNTQEQPQTREQERMQKEADQARQQAEVEKIKQDYRTSQQELADFKPESTNEELNNLRHDLLVKKAELARGKAEGSMGRVTMAKYEEAIIKLEDQVRLATEREQIRQGNKPQKQRVDQQVQYPVDDRERPLTPAMAELKQFKADSPLPQMNDWRREVLLLQAEIESGTLTAEDKAELQAKIRSIREDINRMLPQEKAARSNTQ